MDKKNKELKKHVATIHCSNELSLLERKVSNVLLYHAYPKLLEEQEHVLSVRELCMMLNYSGNNYEAIKQAVRGLITTLMEWNIIDEEGNDDWNASSILASLRLYNANCYYSYSPRMKELLYSPNIYGKIDLDIQARFKSNYGLALYENCIRYQGVSQTRWFDLKTFRRLMGVPETKYPIFRDFNKRVLKKAIQEVNTHSNIQLTPELKKVGRAVSEIKFKIVKKMTVKNAIVDKVSTSANLTKNDESDKSNQLLRKKIVSLFGLTHSQLEQIFNGYEKNYLNEKINLVIESSAFRNGKIENLSGYFLSALKQDYQQPQTSKELLFKKRKIKEQRDLTEKSTKQLKERYNNYKVQKIEEIYKKLSEQSQNHLKQQFEDQVVKGSGFLERQFRNQNYTSGFVMGLFRNFLKQNIDFDIESYDDWLKTIKGSNEIE